MNTSRKDSQNTELPEVKRLGKCPMCGHPRNERKVSLCATLIQALCILYDNGGSGNLPQLFGTSSTYFSSFTRMRYWKLIQRMPDRANWWIITEKGMRFVENKVSVPRSVIVYKDKVRAYSKMDRVRISIDFPESYMRRDATD